jgi:tetrapyrrole methylase family protein/MazG family protein
MIVVVGLGPAGADLLLPAARAALEAVPAARRFVRTSRHPAVADLAAAGITFTSFDDLYDEAGSREAVYEAIVARLVEARAGAAGGDVCFAVPGSPAVGERSVALLRRALGPEAVKVVPGLSYVDLAWLRVGVDPTDGAQLADGQALPAALPAGPVLISHCHSPLVLSDVKLALLERIPPEQPVTVLQRLGLADESVAEVPLADLDRAVEPDHLTCVFVDVPAAGGPGDAWERLVALIERLRAPGGCPWDAEQTHHSLARHLIEETYEVIEAIEALPASAPGGPDLVPEGAYEALEEELGDLACQVVFHATFAREAGAFTITEVLNGIHDKLVRRHPHVFGDVSVTGADQVVANWEQIKRAEKGRTSLMDGVPRALPSLLYAHKLYRKAASARLAWGTAGEAVARAAAELDAAATAPGPGEAEVHLGEALGAVVYLARLAGIDAETALRGWAARFRERFSALEELAAARGEPIEALDASMLASLWAEAGATSA